MPYSTIDNQCPVNRDHCAVSIVHDINARDRDYYNGFIILERVNREGTALIDLFELVVEENGQAKINHMKLNGIEGLKKVMAKKDCYAYSFDISSTEATTLIKNISLDTAKLSQKDPERSVVYTRVKKTGFFTTSALSVEDTIRVLNGHDRGRLM